MSENETTAGRAALRRPARPQRESARAENIREAGEANDDAPVRLTRTRHRGDKLYIDPKSIPRGTSYEWKRMACYGMSDRFHMNAMIDNHWKPVPASRHPGVGSMDSNAESIIQDGLILMERPEYLTKEAQDEDYQVAMAEVDANIKQAMRTPDGTLTRNHESVRSSSRIKKEWSPLTDLADE